MPRKPLSRRDALDKAHALLQRFILVDGHNDLPYVIWKRGGGKASVQAFGLDREHQDHDTDIPKLKRGRVGAQVLAAFIPGNSPDPAKARAEVLDVILQIEQTHPDVFHPVRRAADFRLARARGKIGSFIAVEGCAGMRGDPGQLRLWAAIGVRLVTLCHNETLEWIDSATDAPRHGGLTAFGRLVVQELNRLGVIIDLAHASDQAQQQVLDLSSAPVAFSHGNAKALCDHPRNASDLFLSRLKANGGIVMPTFVPKFLSSGRREWEKALETPHGGVAVAGDRKDAIAELMEQSKRGPNATLNDLCDHIEYCAQKAGLDHIGIGSDFFGGPTPLGLEDAGCYPAIFAELLLRGWSDGNLAKLAGRNFIRVFRAVEKHGEALRKTSKPAVA